MSETGLWRLSAAQLIDGFQSRDFSPVEVTREILQRIERLNPVLRAYLALTADDAISAAQRAEQAWMGEGQKPLLCGVPVSVKDTIEMEGAPTTYGSLAFRDNVRGDAELVRRLRHAGAVILGKTNTPEFALASHCNNRLGRPGANPWNTAHGCGGSSGGAAAAVAAGLGPIGIGTDSGGSIRQPAAYCGVFGLKPTMQRIPAVQVWRASPARSHNGPITRTVRDTALLMQAIAGPDPRDADSALAPAAYLGFAQGRIGGARVALSHDFGRSEAVVDADTHAAIESTAKLLSSLGCEVIPADPPLMAEPDELEPGVWAYSGDHFAAAEAMVPGFWARHKEELTDYARPIYEAGQKALAWQYRRILRRDRAFKIRMLDWFSSYDFLLCPVSGPAPLLTATSRPESEIKAVSFLTPFNHSHQPAAAVPAGVTSSGLPIAVQIVGRHGDDVGVLRIASAIEAARPWNLEIQL